MVNPSTASRIIELGKQQKSIRDIATEVGLSKTTVSSVLRSHPAPSAPAPTSASEAAPPKPVVATPVDAVNEISLVISDDRATQFLEEINSKAPQEPPDATTAATVPELKSAAKKEAFLNTFLESVASNAAAATPRCLLYTSPSPRDRQKSRMPSSA